LPDILFYDPETLIGTATMQCEEPMLRSMEDPFVLLSVPAPDVDPAEWRADPETGTAEFVDKPVQPDEVDAERDRRIEEGVEFNGHVFEIDARSLSAIVNVVTTGQPYTWITMDNQQVALSVEDLRTLHSTAFQQVSILTLAARALKDLPVIPENYKDDDHWQ